MGVIVFLQCEFGSEYLIVQVQSTGLNKEISAFKGPEYHHLNVATGFISTHLWVTLLARVSGFLSLFLNMDSLDPPIRLTKLLMVYLIRH